jgi:predicted nucleic acid-binding protein
VVSFYLDSSALGKRYVPEAGSVLMDHLIDRVPPDRLKVLSVGVVEVASILVRYCNRGQITAPALAQALNNFGTEIAYAPALAKIDVTAAMIPRAIALVATHSINSTDALVLLSALDEAKAVRAAGDDLVLVSSDHQLLKAARAEGLATFDPATQTQQELDALVGP